MRLFGLLVLFLLAADPARGGFEEALPYAGWSIEPLAQTSLWPFLKPIAVEAPEGSTKMRLYFSWIAMEPGDGFVSIRDSQGEEIERIAGFHQGYLSRSIHDTRATVQVVQDGSIPSFGFSLDAVLHRGCRSLEPGDGRLAAPSTCAELEARVQEIGVRWVRRIFDSGPVYFRLLGEATAAKPSHSETNVQVAGIEEGDRVKTNGLETFVLRGNEVLVYRTYPVEESALIARVPLAGEGLDLLLLDDRLVAVSVEWSGSDWRSGLAYTRVSEISLGAMPAVARELLVPGFYRTARRVGESVRLVLERALRFPEIRAVPEGVEPETAAWDDALDRLESEAVLAVLTRPLAEWVEFPARVLRGVEIPLPVRCDDFLIPAETADLGVVSVATVELGARELGLQDTAMLVGAGEIYQSQANLYVGSPHPSSCWKAERARGQLTLLHKLDVSSPNRSTYRASGLVPGTVVDQFALDEHQGFLRVATTNDLWWEPDPARRTENRVSVLAERSGRLEVVGEALLHAPGERIMSSRFVGGRGFVVTFRRVDPLFTLDLSEPTHPRVVGELTVPGFSTYLHPLDADHLFAIGQDFDEDGQTRNGVALSLYDVRDLARPELLRKEVVGSRMGSSSALYDHRAFTVYHRPDGQIVIAVPFSDWQQPEDPTQFWLRFVSTLKVFSIAPSGIAVLGELSHSGLYQDQGIREFDWWYRPTIDRGLFVDDYVLAVSDAGLNAARLDDLAQEVVALQAPKPVAP